LEILIQSILNIKSRNRMNNIEAVSRKTKEKEFRKRMILSVAKELFFEHSYEKTSMESIAQKAGLAKGTLYLYFSNKDELYVSLLIEGLSLLKQMMVDKANQYERYEDKFVQALAIAFYEFSLHQPQYFSLMMSFNTGNLAKIDCIKTQVTSEIDHNHNEIMSFCVSVVQQGIENGIFNPEEDPKLVVVQLWFSITGAIVMINKHIDEVETVCGVTNIYFIESIANRFLQSLKIRN